MSWQLYRETFRRLRHFNSAGCWLPALLEAVVLFASCSLFVYSLYFHSGSTELHPFHDLRDVIGLVSVGEFPP